MNQDTQETLLDLAKPLTHIIIKQLRAAPDEFDNWLDSKGSAVLGFIRSEVTPEEIDEYMKSLADFASVCIAYDELEPTGERMSAAGCVAVGNPSL